MENVLDQAMRKIEQYHTENKSAMSAHELKDDDSFAGINQRLRRIEGQTVATLIHTAGACITAVAWLIHHW